MAKILVDDGYRETRVVSQAIARIQARILALVCALLGGSGLFLMTAWLLIRGSGHPDTGKHLSLLGHYFIGYSVTWPGSILGFFYGALLGGCIGGIIGKIYNVIVHRRFG